MKISKEIKKLRKRIKPLIDDHVDYLMIGLEFDPKVKTWTATPQFESGGDGHSNYLEQEGAKEVLQGEGKTLPAAIKDLNKKLDHIEGNDIVLFRWH